MSYNKLKNMKKEGSLAKRKNIFEKKKTGLYRVLLGHPSSGLTRQDDRFYLGQLQARILNEMYLAKTPGHPGPGLTCRAKPSLITMMTTIPNPWIGSGLPAIPNPCLTQSA